MVFITIMTRSAAGVLGFSEKTSNGAGSEKPAADLIKSLIALIFYILYYLAVLTFNCRKELGGD